MRSRTRKISNSANLMVNRAIFMSSVQALTVYISEISNVLNNLQSNSLIDKDLKKMLSSVYMDHLQTLAQIAIGFESSLTEVIQSERKGGLLN